MKCQRQHTAARLPLICPRCLAIVEILEQDFWCDHMHPDDKIECECGTSTMQEWSNQ